ncbi:MAG: outer membrane lipoprotein-sorting protein [Bacteroidales bacterium]|jgi:outer membrane lipoprotein-sorting protein|nr:outer membrane lipoprotein-sorting protein [Bacteroidales bacterium]
MKKSTAFFSAFFLVLGTTLSAQSVDEILKEHFAASGQDNILKLNAQKLSGKMIQSGIEIPMIQMSKRPAKVRVEGTFQGLTFIQTYNGKEGWSLNPFTGVTDPQQMTEDDLKGMHYQADMDGMLWNWSEKGYIVTFEGKEDMEGTSCFKLKLATKEGDSFTFYIDSDSYILLRTNTKMKIMGNETESDTYYSNYSIIEGIAVPQKIETKMKDQLMGTIVIEKVEFNIELDDALFEKPAL